jgi:hypothetical protein
MHLAYSKGLDDKQVGWVAGRLGGWKAGRLAGWLGGWVAGSFLVVSDHSGN